MSEFKTMKTVAFAAPAKYITGAVKLLREGGYDVVLDRVAGTMVASFTENGTKTVVARALKMRSTWCLRACPEVLRAA